MSDFYTSMAATASRLITKYGQSLLLLRSGDSTDPVTGTVTTGSSVNYKINGILQTYPNNLIDGTRIKSSDRLVMTDATVTPLMGDKIKLESQDWNIESIKTLNPASTALVHFIQVRR